MKAAVAVVVAVPFVVTLVASHGVLGRHMANTGSPSARRPQQRQHAAPKPSPTKTRDTRSPSPAPSRSSQKKRPAPRSSGDISVQPPPKPTPTMRPYHVTVVTRSLVGLGSQRCVDGPDGAVQVGAQLQIRNCDGTSSQQWTFEPDGTVRSQGRCMAAAWGETAGGTAVVFARCAAGPAQHFVLNSAGDLVNTGSNKCVDVTDGKTSNDAPLQLWECTGTANQKWNAA